MQRLRHIALAVALAFCLFSSLQLSRRAFAEPTNGAPAQLARFAPAVRETSGSSVVGYFSDVPDGTDLTPPFPIRFAFAPRMLVWFPDPAVAEWVIGDFSKPQDYEAAGKQLGLKLVRNLGHGVVLYRR